MKPYYFYQCDLAEGTAHFRTTVAKGIEIVESLRGHTTGLAVPTYIIDAIGGGGKTPVMPDYVITQAPGQVILRNYEGVISTLHRARTTTSRPSAIAPTARPTAIASAWRACSTAASRRSATCGRRACRRSSTARTAWPTSTEPTKA